MKSPFTLKDMKASVADMEAALKESDKYDAETIPFEVINRMMNTAKVARNIAASFKPLSSLHRYQVGLADKIILSCELFISLRKDYDVSRNNP